MRDYFHRLAASPISERQNLGFLPGLVDNETDENAGRLKGSLTTYGDTASDELAA
jgi:hypothetical protein